MADYKWHPIEPLSDEDRAIDRSEITPLLEAWLETKDRLPGLQSFTEQLIRSMSIETGVLERLYTLDQGVTQTLVLKGFHEGLVSRESTNIEPALLIDILKDHQAAAQMVMDAVAGNRELTKGLIHELHSVLTQHQPTAKGVDQFGNEHEIPLLRGRYKERPNNPTRPDGSVHEYCPPIHVDSEMDNLLRWFKDYAAENRILVTAWFHHRFAQIHPYQDGNGRLARALVMLMLVRAKLPPLVVERQFRSEYLDALREADDGSLADLVHLLARFETKAVVRSLYGAPQATGAAAAIDAVAHKIAPSPEIRRVHEISGALLQRGKHVSVALLKRFDSLPGLSTVCEFQESTLRMTVRGKSIELILSVSFDHPGSDFSEIMEASPSLAIVCGPRRSSRSGLEVFEPFAITAATNPRAVEGRFDAWLDRTIAIAFNTWKDQL